MQGSLNDPVFVKEQYQDASNLDARFALHERFSTATRKSPVRTFDHFDLPPAARVLELGCGTGALWRANRERVPVAWQLTLTDFSFDMVKTVHATSVAARFAQCDAQAIPFSDSYFDAAIANHMLYHVSNIPCALAEIHRVLKTGGTLYAATNGRNHMHEIDELTGGFGVEAASTGLSFTLESGEQILASHFSSVRRINFADELVVTEVEPLLTYILSMFSARGLRGSRAEAQLRHIIAERIARDGAIRITKAAGLFIARAD